MPNTGFGFTHRPLPQRTPLLDRVDNFRRKHPEIRISAPYTGTNGKWEVSEPDEPAKAFDRGTVMMDWLEDRYES